jgi:ferric-dicitrate binding protein FerR (iron transport regulator)
MTTEDDGSDSGVGRVLRKLGASGVTVEDPALLDERRQRLMPVLSSFAERSFEERRRRWRRAIPIAAAVAALCATVLVALSVRREAPEQAEAARGASVLSGQGAVRVGSAPSSGAPARFPLALRDHDRVETLDGNAEVLLASGASVALDPSTRLDLDAVKEAPGTVDERVVLPAGRIRVRVPKLAGKGQLVVATPNATVTVHGTAFVVEVGRATTGTGTETRVSVSEGVVSVASSGREIFLRPGASWSSAPAPASPPGDPLATASAGPLQNGAPPAGSTSRRSTLSEENTLFKNALAARRSGHPDTARALLGKLLAKYPSSPLADPARSELREVEAELRSPGAP